MPTPTIQPIGAGKRVAVWHGDALKSMRRFPAQCFALTVCSPPYEDARTYGIGFRLRGQAWAEWCADYFVECLRLTRGPVCWVVGHGKTERFQWSAAPALLIAELVRRGVVLRNPPLFCRVGIPGSGGPDWFRADAEWIVCGTATRGKLPYARVAEALGHAPKWGPGGEMSNRLTDGARRNQWGGGEKSSNNRRQNGERQDAGRPSRVLAPVRPFGKQPSSVGRRADGSPKPAYFNGRGFIRGLDGHNPDGTLKRNREGVPMPVKANPGNLMRCVVGGNQMGSKLAHENEAPYPEALVERFVKAFCPPGEMVFDPFGGSGTTLAAALKLGRRAVCIDVRPCQVEIMRRRVREAGEASH